MAIYRIPVELHNTNFPSTMVNVWHGRADSSGAIWDPAQAANSMLGALQTFYVGIADKFAAGTVVRFPTALVDVTTQEETAIGNPPADITTTHTTIGPKGLSLPISWKTSIRARRGRGRTFLGPLGNIADNNSGEVPDAVRLSIQNLVDDLVDASGGVNGWALGVYGQENAGVETPKVLRDFTSGTCSREFSLLRSRRD